MEKQHKTPFEILWARFWKKKQKRQKQFYKDRVKASIHRQPTEEGLIRENESQKCLLIGEKYIHTVK